MKNLKNEILELYKQQDELMQKQYNRSLSFQDNLFDRFERAKRLGFGEGASVYNSALIFGKIEVGIKTWIGPYVVLDGSSGYIKIGEYCSISAGVHIYTHDSVMWALSGGKETYNKGNIDIGSNTYLGACSIIKAGIRIGKMCVVGANSFVNCDVDHNSIVVGSPAKKIGEVVESNGQIELMYFT